MKKWSNRQSGEKVPVIDNNIIIGAEAVILSDVKTVNNSVIGVNAVVLQYVPTNNIAVGVPTKIKSRS